MCFFVDLDDSKVTKPRLRKVIRAVSKWREIAEVFDTPENMKKILEMQAELDRLMMGLGAKIKKSSVKVSAPRMYPVVLKNTQSFN